jgi:phage shock protein C
MYCNYCGKVVQDDANICAYCGKRIGAVVARKRLVRPRQGRKIAGVCLGFAEYFDLDVTLVRIVWLISSVMTGIGLLSYPIAWVIMPEEPLPLAAPGGQPATNP